MNLNDLFLLYDESQPAEYEIKDTSHGGDDFRQSVFARWPNRKIAIKITCNDFTTPERIQGWHDTIEAYRGSGYYCPRIITNRDGNLSEIKTYQDKKCVIYAEEYSAYPTAEKYKISELKRNGRYIFHDAAALSIGKIGARHLTTMTSPSGYCIFQTFSPSDPCDEVMETALSCKKIIDKDLPRYQNRFDEIWKLFLANKEKLSRVYSRLPVSVFQSDLNKSNLLLDENKNMVGLLDFNLCGRDTILNYLFRESMVDLNEDIPNENDNKVYYSASANDTAVRSLLYNISIVKKAYAFTDFEKESAVLIYRYLRPFWWGAFHELSKVKDDAGKVEEILDWMVHELTRGDINFSKAMPL